LHAFLQIFLEVHLHYNWKEAKCREKINWNSKNWKEKSERERERERERDREYDARERKREKIKVFFSHHVKYTGKPESRSHQRVKCNAILIMFQESLWDFLFVVKQEEKPVLIFVTGPIGCTYTIL
jgi:hypothetical protein